MQGGVEQGVEEDEPCVRRLSDTELAMGWLGNGEDVAYVLPIIIWQFSANFRTGLIYGCICMMYIFLSYWFLLFFLSSPQQEACNRQ